MYKIIALTFLILSFSPRVHAASYILPGDFGNGIFNDCSLTGSDYHCTSNISIPQNSDITLTSDVALYIHANFSIQSGFTGVNTNGNALDITVYGNVFISKGTTFSGNIVTTGNVNIGSQTTFTGHIVSYGNINIGKEGDFTGDITTTGNLNIGDETIVNGICTPTHPQCAGVVVPPTGCDTVADYFNSFSYSRQDGTINWTSDWIESNDDGSALNGDILITGSRLLIENADQAITRDADLSTYSTATLTFDYQESGFDTSSDYLDVEVRGGSNGWTSLQTFAGSEVGSGRVNLSIASSFLASDFQIRFITSNSLGGSDRFYVDNLQIEVCSGASQPPAIDFHFDEVRWTGVSGEVIDSSLNAAHASISPSSGLNTIANGAVCGAGHFDGSNDYIVSNDIYALLKTTASMSFWIKTTQTGNDTNWLAPGITGIEQGSSADDIFWGWLDASGHIGISKGDTPSAKSTVAINDGSYHHIVLTRYSPTGAYKIYIDGVLNLSGTTGSGDVGNSFSSIGRIEDTEGSPEYLQGDLDEIMVFDSVLSDAAVSAIYTNQLAGNNYDGTARACAGQALDHFNVNTGAGAANTCTPFEFTITAEDSSNNPVTDYAGTVLITTSTSNGIFNTVTASNNTNPNPDDDNGSVGYTFIASDNGTIRMSIENSHVESLTINVDDSLLTLNPQTGSNTVSFNDIGFTITDIDLNVAGDNVPVAGLDHSYRIQAIRLDPTSGCGVATDYIGTKSLKLWRSKHTSDPATALAPSLAGTQLPASEPAADNASINFTLGQADVLLSSSDIGRFTLEVKDDSGLFTTAAIAGTSAVQIVRPFGLGIDFGTTATGGSLRDADHANGGLDGSDGDISYSTDHTGSVFTQAGENFWMTVEGVLRQAADDTDNNGIPDAGSYLGDNNPAPSFGQEGESVIISASNPRPGSLGVLTGTTFDAFVAGSQTIKSMNYSNVGVIDISATLSDGDYFTSGVNISGSALNVGRFNPHHYTVTAAIVNDACGTFTYAGQTFDANVTLEAQNLGGARTDGYRDGYATLDIATELNVQNGATNAAFDGAAYTINENFSDVTGTFGQAQFDIDLRWDMPEQAETSSAVQILGTSDEVTLLSPSPTTLGSTNVRFGRLWLGNVFGSELIDLTMPMRTQYYDGSNYILNINDSCTSIDHNIVNELGVTQSLSGGGSSTVSVNSITANGGVLDVNLTAPGADSTGFVDVVPNLTISGETWLQYDWDSTTPGQENPRGRANFGIYNGNPLQIYIRQIYQ